MAVKRSRRARRNKNDSGESAAEARLAPLEERSGGAIQHQVSHNDGTLVLDTGQLKLPPEVEEEKTAKALAIDPAVLVILCFALVFIAVIAYIVWQGWEPPQ